MLATKQVFWAAGSVSIGVLWIGGACAAEAPAESATSPVTTEARVRVELSEVIVTGSRLRQSGEGAAPVIVFDRPRIEQLGVTNLADVLSYLPQQPFSVNEFTNVGGARAVQLRGLGLGTTLVLINGRRTVTSAVTSSANYFDLNTIPLAAVERVEVLADSASAIYGADAVGGVVNIILRSDIERPSLALTYGSAEDGAGERQASFAFGHSTERFRTSAVLSYEDRDFLNGDERNLSADQDYTRFGSTDRRVTTSNPGNITSVSSANLPGLASRSAAVPAGSTGVGLTPESFAGTAGQVNRESLSRFSSIIPEATRYAAQAVAELDLLESLTVSAELFYAKREDTRLRSPMSLSNRVVPATNAFNPFGQNVSVNWLFSDIGPRRDRTEAESLRGVLALKGLLGTWEWEVSALGLNDEADSRTFNNVDIARVDAALASSDPDQALNVFQDGPGGSAALLSSLVTAPVVDSFVSDAIQESAFVRGPLLHLPGGAVEAIVGGEHRTEKLTFDARSANVLLNEDRAVTSAYAEARIPLVGADTPRPGIRKLTLTLAGRLDDYSDFGSTFNPQFGLEWSPAERWLLRASYGTSYRAPALFELYQPVLTTPSVPFVDPRRGNQSAPGTRILGGNPGLDPEESQSLVTGFVFTSLNGLRVGASYWRVLQNTRILRPDVQSIIANENLFPSRITRAAPSSADIAAGQPGQILVVDATGLNAGRLDTDGIDFELSDSIATAAGRFTPHLKATWVNEYRAAAFPTAPIVDRVGVANTDGTISRWRAVGSLAWDLRRYQLNVAIRYAPAYDDASTANVRTGRTVPSQTLVDLQGSINLGEPGASAGRWLDGMSIRAGLRNVFDEEPRFTENTANGYDASLADLRQRYGYITLTKTF